MRRVALVTGASRGIGLAIARGLGRAGLDVVVGARGDGARRAAQALRDEGLSAQAVDLDVTDPASVARLPTALDRLHVLVNNAGVNLDGDATAGTQDLSTVQATLDVNLLGAWRTAQAVLPLLLREPDARIVNVSSGVGALATMTEANWPAYRVSKAALNALTRVLAAELRADGVLVNAACPGWVRTGLGGEGAPRSAAEGADTPIWLATLPAGGPTGGFFRDRAPAAW